jgi:hypothetical protein
MDASRCSGSLEREAFAPDNDSSSVHVATGADVVKLFPTDHDTNDQVSDECMPEDDQQNNPALSEHATDMFIGDSSDDDELTLDLGGYTSDEGGSSQLQTQTMEVDKGDHGIASQDRALSDGEAATTGSSERTVTRLSQFLTSMDSIHDLERRLDKLQKTFSHFRTPEQRLAFLLSTAELG